MSQLPFCASHLYNFSTAVCGVPQQQSPALTSLPPVSLTHWSSSTSELASQRNRRSAPLHHAFCSPSALVSARSQPLQPKGQVDSCPQPHQQVWARLLLFVHGLLHRVLVMVSTFSTRGPLAPQHTYGDQVRVSASGMVARPLAPQCMTVSTNPSKAK